MITSKKKIKHGLINYLNNKTMIYYKLNNNGTNWIKTKYKKGLRQIKLYDDNLNFKGIGLY